VSHRRHGRARSTHDHAARRVLYRIAPTSSSYLYTRRALCVSLPRFLHRKHTQSPTFVVTRIVRPKPKAPFTSHHGRGTSQRQSVTKYCYMHVPLRGAARSSCNMIAQSRPKSGTGRVATPGGGDQLIAAAHIHSTVFARWRQCAQPYNTPPHSPSQTEARSNQSSLQNTRLLPTDDQTDRPTERTRNSTSKNRPLSDAA